MGVPLGTLRVLMGSGSGSSWFIRVIRAIFCSILGRKKNAGPENPDFLRFGLVHPDETLPEPDAGNLGPTCQISDRLVD